MPHLSSARARKPYRCKFCGDRSERTRDLWCCDRYFDRARGSQRKNTLRDHRLGVSRLPKTDKKPTKGNERWRVNAKPLSWWDLWRLRRYRTRYRIHEQYERIPMFGGRDKDRDFFDWCIKRHGYKYPQYEDDFNGLSSRTRIEYEGE